MSSPILWPRRMRPWQFMLAAVLVPASVVIAQTTATLLRETVEEEYPQAGAKYREGMQLTNAAGSFERTGDRISFVIAGGERFLALENLNLERIADKLDVDSGPLSWSVSGTITEYRGRYYLLISRARAKRSTQQALRLSPSGRGVHQ